MPDFRATNLRADAEVYAQTILNVRDWNNLTNRPVEFTPTAHNHDAADITTGTVADARLSANVAKRDAANTFTGIVTVASDGIIIDRAAAQPYAQFKSSGASWAFLRATASNSFAIQQGDGSTAIASFATSGIALNHSTSVAGALTVGGTTQLNGNVSFGSATTELVGFNNNVITRKVRPAADAAYNLGDATYRWANLHVSGAVNAATAAYSGAVNVSGQLTAGGRLYLESSRTVLRGLESTHYHLLTLASETATKTLNFRLTNLAETAIANQMSLTTSGLVVGSLSNTATHMLQVQGTGKFTGAVSMDDTLATGGFATFGGGLEVGNAAVNYQALEFNPTTALAGFSGTIDIQPHTVPGAGTAEFATRFANKSAAGTTAHNVIVDSRLFINTTTFSSAYRLDVNGPVRFAGSTTLGSALSVAGQAGFAAGSAAAPSIAYSAASSTGLFFSGNEINFSTAGAERGRITAAGVLAWGTSVTTGTVAGDLVAAYDKSVRSVDSGGTTTHPLLRLHTIGAVTNVLSLAPVGNLSCTVGNPASMTGALAGDLTFSNNRGIRSANPAGTLSDNLIREDTNGHVDLGRNDNLIRIGMVAAVNIPVGGAAADRGIIIDSTNNALIYFVNGARYRLTGTAF